jgi:hypothetical protein
VILAVVDKVCLRMAAFVSFVLSECGEMNEVDVRRVLGRRVVTGEIVMAVLHAVRMWGGVRLLGSGRLE